MTTTITHDPDDPRGCSGCPFQDLPRICAVDDASDDDCPLRHGGVHVRAPEPVADHHEPAEGDVVRVADDRPFAAAERRRAVMIADLSRDLDTATAALGSIASALGMSPDALPGAIVERVEMTVRERDEARRDAATWKLQSDSLDGSIEAALGDACTGDLAADVRRVVAERARLRETVSVFGMSDEPAIRALTEARARIAELERGTDRGNERDLRRILDSVRALLGMRDDADESNADDEIPGHLSTALAWTAQLETINDQLRAYLARAIRGCDRREQRAIEADLASDGLATEVV